MIGEYFVRKGNSNCKCRAEEVDDNTIDLLNRMLELYPERRITAAEALKHPFFDEINQFN